MDFGTDPRTLGGATLWPFHRRAVGSGHHADSDGHVGTVGDPGIPREADIGLDDLDGLVALGLLVPAELAGVVWVRGLSLHEYLASLVTAPGLVSLFMFLLFGAMPTLVARESGASWRGSGHLHQQFQ